MKRSFSNRFRLVATPLLLLTALVSPLFAGWEEGVAAFQAKNFKAAASHFKAVVEQYPEEYRGHYMLGLSLGAVGKKAPALSHLKAAYDLNPNDLSLNAAIDELSKLSGKEMQKASAELGTALVINVGFVTAGPVG
jgi:tetratricopeptide (TPR) repeat protein